MLLHTSALGIFCLLVVATSPLGAGLQLAREGATAYRIVKADHPSPVDEYAVRTLADYLRQITGAEFPVVDAAGLPGGVPAVFVGLSAQAVKRLGGTDPLAGLKDQEHVARSLGSDIFLYGKGVHSNLHAVMDFLEASLGWRWYSVYERPVVPSRPTVTLAPFKRKKGFSFASREVALYWNPDFYYQHGMNMGSEKWGRIAEPQFVPYLRNDKFVHSLFAYVPPSPDATHARTFDWLSRRNYFATNPDFFTMDHNGKRVPNRQLCFGNPALRAELTANVVKHLAVAPGNQIITIDAEDSPGKFCYCAACKALEETYRSPGGPLFDYLFEICTLLKREHPGVMVKTLAYRRSQTQKPPVLPAVKKLPDNLIISFAPIEDNYFADWTHPHARIQETYADLKAWNKITHPGNLWAWLYPNPWGTGIEMPVGNLERNISQMRLMYRAGVRGIFTDHCGFLQRSGLSELQGYLLYKLMQDVNCDTNALIREFTDHQYGAAAPLARKYLAQLEQGRKDMRDLPPGVTFSSPNLDDRTFPYLTTANIHRWQTWFDEMERQVADAPERLLNLRLLRRELDFATLWKWFDLKKAFPDYFRDHAPYVDRIAAVNGAKAQAGMQHRPLGAGTLQDFLAVIQGGGQSKPLPEQFAGTPPDRIRQYLPRNYDHGSDRKTIADPDAAFGYAATVHLPDMPFEVGFYQWINRDPGAGVHGARIKVDRDRITPGVYRLYELGEIVITPDSWIWFSAKSWATRLEIGDRLYEPGANNRWHAWVSTRFDGPTYGGQAKEDLVLVDRIILVAKR